MRTAVRQHSQALQHAHAFQERDIGMSSWWRRKRTMPHQNNRPRNCCMTTISCCRKKEKPIIRNERLCKDHTERVPVTRVRETAATGRKAKVQDISERTTSNRSSPNVKNSDIHPDAPQACIDDPFAELRVWGDGSGNWRWKSSCGRNCVRTQVSKQIIPASLAHIASCWQPSYVSPFEPHH